MFLSSQVEKCSVGASVRTTQSMSGDQRSVSIIPSPTKFYGLGFDERTGTSNESSSDSSSSEALRDVDSPVSHASAKTKGLRCQTAPNRDFARPCVWTVSRSEGKTENDDRLSQSLSQDANRRRLRRSRYFSYPYNCRKKNCSHYLDYESLTRTNSSSDEESNCQQKKRVQKPQSDIDELKLASRTIRKSQSPLKTPGKVTSTGKTVNCSSNNPSEKESSESCEEDSLIGLGLNPLLLTAPMETRDYRRKLDDELAMYKQKLASYQDGQQRQCNLVQRLQAKVLQYKEKCRTLELKLQLAEAENQNRKAGMDENTAEYESTLMRLEEEQQRATTLASVNTMLREQLDQATQANQSLSSENQRFREEAARFREILERREAEWRDEEAAFNDYFTMEHNRLLTLWRAVVACRRQFVEIKGQVEREIGSARSDVSRIARTCQAACENFASNLRATEAQQLANLEWEQSEKKKLQRQLEELSQIQNTTRLQLDTEKKSAAQRLDDAKSQIEDIQRQLADRDRTIASLQRLRTGQALCGKREGYDIVDPASRTLVEEVQTMQQSLRDLAQSVLNNELESYDFALDCHHRSRSRSPCYASNPSMQPTGTQVSRAGAYGRTGSPPPPINATNSCYWADSTLGAVQAAFHKQGLQLSDLSNKLASSKEQQDITKRQLEDSENERRNLEHQLLRMRAELDNTRREREEAGRDLDRCKASLQNVNNEKIELDKLRISLTEQVKATQAELDRQRNSCCELQRTKDRLEEELAGLGRDAERSLREADRCQRCIEGLEERLSVAREEGTGLREALQCARLEAEIKATERADLQEALTKSEARRMELEGELTKLHNQETTLNERIAKQQAKIEDLISKRQATQVHLRNLETEYAQLGCEYRNVESERAALREALIQMETQKNEIATEKNTATQALTVSQAARERLEDEVSRLNREKIDVTEQFNAVTRHKNGLANELAQKARDNERLREVVCRLNSEKEDLTKEKGELVGHLKIIEREIRQTTDLLAATKKEHQNLEADYYQVKQQIVQLETQRDLLENENQELNIKRDNLICEFKRAKTDLQQEVDRITQARDQAVNHARNREQELLAALQASKEAGENEANALRHQLIETREQADSQMCDIIAAHKSVVEDLKNQALKDKETYQNELMTLQRERDEAALAAEADKQAILSANERDRAMLNERLVGAQQQCKCLDAEIERIKREAQARHERDDTVKAELSQELKEFRKHFEETCAFHEQNNKELQNKHAETVGHRDELLKEIDELQVQIKMLEEARDGLQKNVLEANRRLRETDEARETLRKEIIDLRRTISETQLERDTFAESKEILAKRVKDLEAEKVDQTRQICDDRQQIAALEEQKCTDRKEINELRSSLRDSEKTRLDVRRDLQETRRQLREAHNDRERQAKDILELQARLSKEEEKNEEMRQENFTLKQRIGELEAARSSLKKEFNSAERRIADLQESLASREREFKQAMDHATCEHRRLTDARNQLQNALEAANTEATDLRIALTAAENKITDGESELAQNEAARRDLEFRLASIHSSLRRLIGFRQGCQQAARRRRSNSRSPIREVRSPANSRQASPCKDSCAEASMEGRRVYAADLDPEAVRLALHEFVQRYTNLRRDMEDAQAQIRSLQSRLQEQAEQTEQWARRLHQVQQALCEAEADRKGVDGRLSSTQTALMLQEETLRKNERDRKQMADKISQMERQLAASGLERREDQDKLNKLRQSEARLEEEQRLSRKALEEAENRITQLEVIRRSLEGDLQRMKICVSDKEAENQVLEERIANLCKQIQDLESKSQSLQLTVDRLSIALSKSEELENASKDKMQQLNMSLSDHNQTIQDLQERLAQLQKALANSEQDRRMSQERLENTRSLLHEHKHQNQQLNDRLQMLQAELTEADVRRGELESQNRQIGSMLNKRQESEQELNKQLQQVAKDRQELQERLASTQRNLAEAEAERDQLILASTNLEKDRHTLRRHLEKAEKEKMQQDEIMNRGNLDRTELELTLRRLEEENNDQKRQVHFLQARLNELEQMHAQRLADVASRQRAETELEMERLRNNQTQAERALEARERAHRQRVKALEDQVVRLKVKMAAVKEQLAMETRKRQQILTGKSGMSRQGDVPGFGSSREVRRLLEAGDAALKPCLSTADMIHTPCCGQTEKRPIYDRNRSSSRGVRLVRK
ncbi:unnamed protein product [Calicophoron daubneyi]|uniref:Rootletin n=1 Tax=Calicophoron daubneyi TaxID=300641 RepID=A0AAV2TBF1_CALDB